MTGFIERFGRALGVATREMRASALKRKALEATPHITPHMEHQDRQVELKRCPRCGTYSPAGTPCVCAGG